MKCTICSITNKALREDIEQYLLINDGFLSDQNKTSLKMKYADEESVKDIDAITDADCTLHFNFHIIEQRTRPASTTTKGDDKNSKASIADDVGKDEAQILSELANTQMATFNLLTKKINKALEDTDSDASSASIHPTIIQLYRETAVSIRESVNDIKELNSSINGSADSALEGLKALAKALHPSSKEKDEAVESDGTTSQFD